MLLTPVLYENALDLRLTTYEQAQSLKNSLVWKALEKITVEEALKQWFETLHSHTRRAYRAGMKKIVEFGLLDPFSNLQAFSLINHEVTLDKIKRIPTWSECTRQARAACYISFTAFLERRLQGVIKKAITNREKGSKTFFKVREKVKTNAMNQSQWSTFLSCLQQISERDCLIAKIILQGGKRISEVLSLETHQIDWEKNEITFLQSKTKGYTKETVITYPLSIMNRLKYYVGVRSGYVFLTRYNKKITLFHIAKVFSIAGNRAKIPFKVTPHVLRASTVTYLKNQGFSDSNIMYMTGHASSELIHAYDKNDRANNASKKVALVS